MGSETVNISLRAGSRQEKADTFQRTPSTSQTMFKSPTEIFTLTAPEERDPKQQNNSARIAEITTAEQYILYASVRTTAAFSQVPGTCHADIQETGVEYLTDPTSMPKTGPDVPIPIWYSNQAVDPKNLITTQETGPETFDCTKQFHEYAFHRTWDFTAFYIDDSP
ncbi:uncharacterized protein Z518_07620 [Rhinocladiella mackenziei CBS 650.93]|uniref:Rhinocladiella mackenziei CBS 650.93 unplaced genomic scaffold supercont1.5, whole genome shotgun sequence n=1 Tax=Rhinocladiella mackenziei CBS 650.93 TaxID=1442369 RepID=A0A0D2FPH1_9EURO|nr:uncharacterized protein Z518_07620 [Rhinocladiella mackenziei CBS 650.93]KIX04067.1 hypothetical protein Z518_07620 [Rhinocladiella mackenziei CBS 650.93]